MVSRTSFKVKAGGMKSSFKKTKSSAFLNSKQTPITVPRKPSVGKAIRMNPTFTKAKSSVSPNIKQIYRRRRRKPSLGKAARKNTNRVKSTCFGSYRKICNLTKNGNATTGRRHNPSSSPSSYKAHKAKSTNQKLSNTSGTRRRPYVKTAKIPRLNRKAGLSGRRKVSTAAMEWGIKNEKKALRAYERIISKIITPVRVKSCPMSVHPRKKYIAGKPDGIVRDKLTGEILCIVEVKCPYKHRYHTISEACAHPRFCLEKKGTFYQLKTDHHYYAQVQKQLGVTGMKYAHFVVYTTKDIAIAYVPFNPTFWKKLVEEIDSLQK